MSEDKDADLREVEDDGMDVKRFLAEPDQSESFTRNGGHNDEKLLVKLSAASHFDNNNDSGPSTACEDYLTDSDFFDKDSGCEDINRKSLSFEKSNSETHSVYCGSEISIKGVSKSSSFSDEKTGVKNEIDDCQDQGKEKTVRRSPIIYTSQSCRKMQRRLGLMIPPSTLEEGLESFSDLHRDSEQASIISSRRKTKQFSSARHSIIRSNGNEEEKPSNSFTQSSSQRRDRKPPVRYIDEFSIYLPSSDERQRVCGTIVDKTVSVKTSSKRGNVHKTLKSLIHAQHEGRYGNSPNNLFASNGDTRGFSNRITVDLSKEFSPVTRLDSDLESEDESDSDTPCNLARNGLKNSGDRRKHQKSWTLPEVVKLVDGVSRNGVGHWTEIQRLFFPSSCRTPVDLRDKWRNLLKASSASMLNDQEERDEEATKNGHRQLPIEILQRISELSHLHPYPVKRTLNNKLAPKYQSKRK